MSTSPNISFKIRGRDCYHRFNLPAGEDLFERLLDALKGREVHFKSLFWIDEEGDRVALRNLLDMRDALSLCGSIIRLDAESQPEVIVLEAPPADVRTSPVQHERPTPSADVFVLDEGRTRRHHRRRQTRSRSRSPLRAAWQQPVPPPQQAQQAYYRPHWVPAQNQQYWHVMAARGQHSSDCRYCRHQ